ncbi:MAG TPA: hypothetical protein VL945_01300 [Candidatus Saccharimonadales bacterium]|nr:hypothetical protein [Candidatus Saccharimonadales bacterium]
MKDEKIIVEVASDRIARLFEMAERRTESNGRESDALARRYVSLARRISSHYKVKIPQSIRNRICKKCNSAQVPGINCTVRKSSQGYMVYKCSCGNQKRVFLKRSSGSKPV